MQTGPLSHLTEAMDRSAARLTHRGSVRDLDATLGEIVAGAVAAVPGASEAGLTVLEGSGRLLSMSPTGELVVHLDETQAVLREGPCVDAVEHDRAHGDGLVHQDAVVVRVDDMTTEAATRRWPRFAPEAVRCRVASMISVQLVGDRKVTTALNLYAERPRSFDDEAEVTARLFADQAAIALHGAQEVAGLMRSVASRDVIGQAKGILMERRRITGAEAFAVLTSVSQETNIKLVEVARWLIDEISPAAPPREVPKAPDATRLMRHRAERS